MDKSRFVIGAVMLIAICAPTAAAPVDDATQFISSVITKFNNGDTQAWLDAQVNDVVIVDDFGRHVWSGPDSAHHWLDDFTKDAAAKGDSAGHMDFEKPIAADSEGDTAYIVMPTTWRYVEKGTKMAGAGSMTFVVKHEGSGWKIASWTYSGATPVPQK